MPLKLTVARYAVTGQRPPRLTETITLAETVHRALVELSDGSQVFTGCDSSHRPLSGHAHAHIFCESNPGPGRGDGQYEHTDNCYSGSQTTNQGSGFRQAQTPDGLVE